MAPKPPQRSERPGGAVALLYGDSAEAEAAGHEAGDEDDDGDEGHLGVIDVGEGAGG